VVTVVVVSGQWM